MKKIIFYVGLAFLLLSCDPDHLAWYEYFNNTDYTIKMDGYYSSLVIEPHKSTRIQGGGFSHKRLTKADLFPGNPLRSKYEVLEFVDTKTQKVLCYDYEEVKKKFGAVSLFDKERYTFEVTKEGRNWGGGGTEYLLTFTFLPEDVALAGECFYAEESYDIFNQTDCLIEFLPWTGADPLFSIKPRERIQLPASRINQKEWKLKDFVPLLRSRFIGRYLVKFTDTKNGKIKWFDTNFDLLYGNVSIYDEKRYMLKVTEKQGENKNKTNYLITFSFLPEDLLLAKE